MGLILVGMMHQKSSSQVCRRLLVDGMYSIVQSVQAKKTDGPLGHIFGGIQDLLLSFYSRKIHHLKREHNIATHKLTQLAKSTRNSQIWKDVMPPIQHVIYSPPPLILFSMWLLCFTLLYSNFSLLMNENVMPPIQHVIYPLSR